MRNLIAAALVAGSLLAMPSAASASPYLGLSEGRAEIRDFVLGVAALMDCGIGYKVWGWYRVGTDKVRCNARVRFGVAVDRRIIAPFHRPGGAARGHRN